jgi:hypothetical protein
VHHLRTVRFDDLLRGAEAGTIEGDPLRPYLVLDEGWGDAPPVDWATVQTGLEIAWEVAKAVAVATGATTGVVKARKWLLERLGRGRESLRANPEWAQRGYRPDQFESLLANREWKTEDLARLLGCTDDQAEGALWILGYVFDQSEGKWKFAGDEADISLSVMVDAIGYASHQGGAWQSRFRDWMERYLKDDVAPPLEALDLQPSDVPEHEWKPTIGERIDGWLERLPLRRSRRG